MHHSLQYSARSLCKWVISQHVQQVSQLLNWDASSSLHYNHYEGWIAPPLKCQFVSLGPSGPSEIHICSLLLVTYCSILFRSYRWNANNLNTCNPMSCYFRFTSKTPNQASLVIGARQPHHFCRIFVGSFSMDACINDTTIISLTVKKTSVNPSWSTIIPNKAQLTKLDFGARRSHIFLLPTTYTKTTTQTFIARWSFMVWSHHFPRGFQRERHLCYEDGLKLHLAGRILNDPRPSTKIPKPEALYPKVRIWVYNLLPHTFQRTFARSLCSEKKPYVWCCM